MTTAPGELTPANLRPRTRRWWFASAAVLGFGLWWVGSIMVHAVLFGLLYAASPREPSSSGAQSDDFHMTISPDHVASVVAEIREQQKEEFANKVEELARIKAQLDALAAQKVEQYNALMQDEAKQAPQIADQAAAEIRANQEEALKAQDAAQAAVARMNEARAQVTSAQESEKRAQAQQELNAATDAAATAQTSASQAQKKVAAAQVKLKQQVDLFGDATADARQAAQKAEASQAEAEHQQDAAASSRKEIARQQQNTDQLAAELQRAQTADADAQQRIANLEKRLGELQPPPPTPAPSSPEPAASPAAQTTGSDATAPSASPPVVVQTSPTPAPRPASTPSKQARQEIERLNKALPQAREAEAKIAARAKDTQQKLVAAKEEAASKFQKLQAAQEQARQKQQAALEEQKRAEQQITATMVKPGLLRPAETVSTAPPPSAPPGASLADLFRQAQQMETSVAESYRNVRAAELAAIRKIPLSQAMAVTEAAKPVRAEIDTAILTRDIRDVPGVREQEKTIETASGQMSSMVALAQRMKDLAQPVRETTVSVETMKSESMQSERMEQLAMEDEGTKAKDLTAAMKHSEGTSGAHLPGSGAEAMAKAKAALAAASAEFAAHPISPRAALEYRRALEAVNALADTATAGANGSGTALDDPTHRNGAPGTPPLNARHFKPIPGRTITSAMVSQAPNREPSWMFVDSWYLIGPWPNPARKNLDTKFPPETVVDLDATYTGGRRNETPMAVRWHFYQASAITKSGTNEVTGFIVPPGLSDFEIYYGYTELWLDEAEDLWVAIGSDDQSKVWLNDQMIWKSADYYKSWAANEGLRKVHFNKGINRLLYRLENGQFSGGFSFMVCLDPSAPPTPEAKPAGRR